MVYKAFESEHGVYKNDAGVFYDILEAINVMTPQGKNVGWSEYTSIEEAAKAFKLEYIGIKEEE